MAINAVSAELLLLCRELQPKAADFLMLGRQWLRLSAEQANKLSTTYQIKLDDLADPEFSDTIYAEPLLQRMGFQQVESLDATAYQGAGLVHDLNNPLAADLREKWDWVFDGGSLEHVFDFPAAIRNCADLLRPGGLFITMCPVNNWMGHGFYQFSPELFFRAFASEHGFQVRFAALVRHGSQESFYRLRDPAEVGRRVQFNPPGRLSLLFVAQKHAGASIAEVQQSDYSARWEKKDETGSVKSIRPVSHLASLLPAPIRRGLSIWRIKQRRQRENTRGLVNHRTLQAAWKAVR
ncbi:MAG: hypothetical protein R3F13_02515 [Prosthecobacter sp.]